MRSENLRKSFAGTRARFGASLLILVAVSLILPWLLLSTHLSVEGLRGFYRTIIFLLVLILFALLIGLYTLRLKQIERPASLAILAIVPLANLVLPIFLLVENSPTERAGKPFFAISGLGAVVFIGLAVYGFANPPGFSRADPTGCYLVNGKPIFQLRDGKVLLPSGAATGVSYRVESLDNGNAVVSDHELRLARSGSGLKLAIGVAEDRWNSSIDGFGGPEMMMTIGDELRPISAVRHDNCS